MNFKAIQDEKLRLGELLRASKMPELTDIFVKCYPVTVETTVETASREDTFLITGDIPAMWLRDSSAQVRHYLPLAVKDGETADFIEGLLHRQFRCIAHDPYANAFNREPNGHCCCKDDNCDDPLIWERKYEIDSLCAPIILAADFVKATGRSSVYDSDYFTAVEKILSTWETEQHHCEKSEYLFIRHGVPVTDTLSCDGAGASVAYTGMTWSGFRPSDDSCKYGYLLPSNMYAVAALRHMADTALHIKQDEATRLRAEKLRTEIKKGIEQYGTVLHEKFGKIYAYETDGNGNFVFHDDANVPSLLSIPYLGYCRNDDEIYENTRRFVLSGDNPFYYSGKFAKGIGSPHTPKGYIWPIALSMQGLTSADADEKRELLKMLAATHAGTNLMHEGFDANAPENYTRPWFVWSCSLFCEFVQKCLSEGII